MKIGVHNLKRKRPIQHEHNEQVELIQWAKRMERKYPELSLLFAIPNGGKRNVITAVKLKAEGVKAGVPDLCLPVARGGYHACFIEMKAGENKPTAKQEAWIKALREHGNKVCICYGWQEASKEIESYLRLQNSITIRNEVRL